MIDETKPIPQRKVQLLEDSDGDTELYIFGEFQCSWSKDRDHILNVDTIVECAIRYGERKKSREIRQALNIRQ